EEFGVKGCCKNWHAGAVVAVVLEDIGGDVGEVGSVVAGTVQRDLRIVRLLAAQIYFCAGNPPVTMAAGPALFVEFQIIAVAGIAMLAAPDLDASAWVASEEGDMRLG